MNACVVFSAESEKRINVYRDPLGELIRFDVCEANGDVAWSLQFVAVDAETIGKTLAGLARAVREDE